MFPAAGINVGKLPGIPSNVGIACDRRWSTGTINGSPGLSTCPEAAKVVDVPASLGAATMFALNGVPAPNSGLEIDLLLVGFGNHVPASLVLYSPASPGPEC